MQVQLSEWIKQFIQKYSRLNRMICSPIPTQNDKHFFSLLNQFKKLIQKIRLNRMIHSKTPTSFSPAVTLNIFHVFSLKFNQNM